MALEIVKSSQPEDRSFIGGSYLISLAWSPCTKPAGPDLTSNGITWWLVMPSADLRPEEGGLFPVPTRMRACNALGWGGNL